MQRSLSLLCLQNDPDLVFFQKVSEMLDEILAVVEAEYFRQTASKMIIPLDLLLHVVLVDMIALLVEELGGGWRVGGHGRPGFGEDNRARLNGRVHHLLDVLPIDLDHVHPEAAFVTEGLLNMKQVAMAQLHRVLYRTLQSQLLLIRRHEIPS